MPTPTPFGPGHYSRDWLFADAIIEDWERVQRKFGWKSAPRSETIEEHWDEIFGPGSPYPNLVKLGHELQCDQVLHGVLGQLFFRFLEPEARIGFEFVEVLPQALLRLLYVVIRNIDRWVKTKKPADVHWARFWNVQHLLGQIRRACRDLDHNERTPGDDFELDHLGSAPNEERLLEELMEVATRGMSANEADSVRQWIERIVGSNSDTDKQIAETHGLTIRQFEGVKRRAAKNISDEYGGD